MTIMKNPKTRPFLLGYILAMLITAVMIQCTDNQQSRAYGGNEEIILPKGQRLITATWKELNLWYLTEPMPEGYIPIPKVFTEKSNYGIFEGTVTFIESR